MGLKTWIGRGSDGQGLEEIIKLKKEGTKSPMLKIAHKGIEYLQISETSTLCSLL